MQVSSMKYDKHYLHVIDIFICRQVNVMRQSDGIAKTYESAKYMQGITVM